MILLVIIGGVKMMQEQTGQVKYKERDDIYIKYGIVGDKQYYFMKDGKLSNGNIIATTVLVEAIDNNVVPTSLGVITSEGNIVIPFENKKIKPVSDKYLFVERSVPKSDSVLASAKSKDDPMTATKLVTSSNTITDNIRARIGNNGSFLLSNPTCEAAIYDMDGNNVISDNYYSFIAMDDNTFYFSKDTVESPIVEYNFDNTKTDSSADSLEKVSLADSVPTGEDSLDVSKVNIDQDTIEKAIDEATENSVDVSMPTVGEDLVSESVSDLPEQDEVSAKEVVEEVLNEESVESLPPEVSPVEVPGEEDVIEEVADETDEENVQDVEVPIAEGDTLEEIKPIELPIVEEPNDGVSNVDLEDSSSIDKVLDKISKTAADDFVSEDMSSDLDVTEEEHNEDTFDIFKETDMDRDDDKYNMDFSIDSKYDDFSIDDYHSGEHTREDNDTIIQRTADAMNKLIGQNREQTRKIDGLEKQNKGYRDKIVSLEDRVNGLLKKSDMLNEKNHTLEDKLDKQDEVIERQKRSINSLRSQLERQSKGKSELAHLLGIAKDVLGQERTYDYEEEESYGRRVA